MPPTADSGSTTPPASVPVASATAERSFDAFNLFVANIQTGFGPFVAVYLSGEGWTQTAIGLALSVGTITAMASQVPAGALVDAMKNKTAVAAVSVLAFTTSALMFAAHPIPLFVYLAEVLHGVSSCTLGPAIAALSLAIAGRFAMGSRLGRNTRYSAIGNGIGAALMGACGTYVSERAVFVLTAVLTLPALAALAPLRRLGRGLGVASDSTGTAQPLPTSTAVAPREPTSTAPRFNWVSLFRVLADRRLLIFAICAMLFTFANAPLLPLASSTLNASVGHYASLVIAACITVPQAIGALAAPWVGRRADSHGRRALLLLGFAMLPLRGLLLAGFNEPALVIAIQALDGISAACFGVMVPLIVSDVAARSGHFTLSLGVVGFAMGLGGTLSTTIAGWVADHYGNAAAFAGLGGIGLVATLAVLWLMPETRPSDPAAQPLPIVG
jgi:MFS family permease